MPGLSFNISLPFFICKFFLKILSLILFSVTSNSRGTFDIPDIKLAEAKKPGPEPK
jgi:hypothetical protein